VSIRAVTVTAGKTTQSARTGLAPHPTAFASNAASISPVSFACIVKLPSFAEGWRDIMPQRRSGTSQLSFEFTLAGFLIFEQKP